MSRRPAVTLIEALMAIFVMAIGLLALLTLFPLGAVEMAQSLKDERTAQGSLVGIGQWKAFDLGNDPFVNASNPATGASFFENPWPPPAPGAPGLPALSEGYVPTYLALVDPIGNSYGLPVVTPLTPVGVQPVGGAPWPTVGGIPLGIPRATVSRIPAVGQWQQRWFTVQDDITFAENGVPDNGLAAPGNPAQNGAGPIQREGRYSWAYMVRRQMARQPPPTAPLPFPPPPPPNPAFDLTVVVYSGRAPGLDANNLPLGETTYANTTFGPPGNVSPNIVWIDYSAPGQTRPNLRRGSWVLDSRMLTLVVINGVVRQRPLPQGYFYRVVNVTDLTPTLMEVEIQRPLGGPIRGPYGFIPGTNPPQPYPPGPLVVMENVSEVFEKGTDY